MNKVDTAFIDEMTNKRHKSVFTAYLNNPCESLKKTLRYYDSIDRLITAYLDQINEIDLLKKKISSLDKSSYKGQ